MLHLQIQNPVPCLPPAVLNYTSSQSCDELVKEAFSAVRVDYMKGVLVYGMVRLRVFKRKIPGTGRLGVSGMRDDANLNLQTGFLAQLKRT